MAAGRLVALWFKQGTIFAQASHDSGLHWTRPRVIATDVDSPGRMSAALASDGRGWLAYEAEFGSEIRVVPLNARGLLGIKPAPPHHRKHRKHHAKGATYH
ncbi:MAG TPA: hypothetical protein VGF91_04510 [Solirubrobacteraceae bacterium]|jgi:hypothetical protein